MRERDLLTLPTGNCAHLCPHLRCKGRLGRTRSYRNNHSYRYRSHRLVCSRPKDRRFCSLRFWRRACRSYSCNSRHRSHRGLVGQQTGTCRSRSGMSHHDRAFHLASACTSPSCASCAEDTASSSWQPSQHGSPDPACRPEGQEQCRAVSENQRGCEPGHQSAHSPWRLQSCLCRV